MSSSSSSDRLFNRHRTLHQILGGGGVADVILWRRKNLTVGILTVTLAVWVVFERSGYTLLSLVSSVLFLLSSILFLWAKSASILNRPAPPLPRFYLSEETANQALIFIRDHINALLSVCEDIATGKDPRMFIKVAASLLLISIIGGFTDFPTLCYTSVVILLTVPVLYEMCEDVIDKYLVLGCRKLQNYHKRIEVEYISKIRNWILEQKKLS